MNVPMYFGFVIENMLWVYFLRLSTYDKKENGTNDGRTKTFSFFPPQENIVW